MKNNDKEFLYQQLIKLGDMIGDGFHLEPEGKWIAKEYKRIAKELGLIPKRESHTEEIDRFMQKRITCEKCGCGGELKQTRSGSFVAQCKECRKKYRLGCRK